MNKDVIVEIGSYLNPLDKYNFLIALKFYDMIKQHIIHEINSRLMDVFGNQLANFKQCMKETGSMISGSFILQCILKEEWKNSDIDIYVPMIGNTIYMPKAEQKGETIYMKSNVDNFMHYQMHFDGHHDNYAIHDYIKYVRTYFNNTQHIQIIGVDIEKDTLLSFVNETFDFSICKNIYDGKGNLILSNLHDIYHKTLNFNSTRSSSSSIDRYYKYQNRGFVFKNKDLLTYHDLKPTNVYVYREKQKDVPSKYQDFMKHLFGDTIECPLTYEIKHRYHPEKCTRSCIIRFLDEGIKHKHIDQPYLDRRHGHKEDDHIFICI